MAAGVTSGVVAVVLQANHRLTPNALKAVLEYTSRFRCSRPTANRYDALSQGTGQIQAEGAVDARAAHQSAGGGRQRLACRRPWFIDRSTVIWCHDDNSSGRKTHHLWGNASQRRRRVQAARRARLEQSVPAHGGEQHRLGQGARLMTIDIFRSLWGNASSHDDDNIVWGNSSTGRRQHRLVLQREGHHVARAARQRRGFAAVASDDRRGNTFHLASTDDDRRLRALHHLVAASSARQDVTSASPSSLMATTRQSGSFRFVSSIDV